MRVLFFLFFLGVCIFLEKGANSSVSTKKKFCLYVFFIFFSAEKKGCLFAQFGFFEARCFSLRRRNECNSHDRAQIRV